MSIPTSFDPLGTLGGNWREVDMDGFVNSTWNTSEITPCGYPNGGFGNGRQCRRNTEENMLFFGYKYRGTTTSASVQNNGVSVPPRNESEPKTAGTPALEFWLLGQPKKLRMEFTMSKEVSHVYATPTDWKEGDGYEDLEFTQIGENEEGLGIYSFETPFAAQSVIIKCTSTSMSGTITKIRTK